MDLAIIHYHLNRGGVTRVIENQLRSLEAVLPKGRPWRVGLLFGGRRDGLREELLGRLRAVRLSLHEVPWLDYDEVQPGGCRAAGDLYGKLVAELDGLGFTPRGTVLHVHNHSLGKNRHLPGALTPLAERGYALLLQIHDFAEDFRPDNYRRLQPEALPGLYPQAEGIHYAVLNGRDREILQQAGAAPTRLHLLPNPVPEPARLPPRIDARRRLKRLFAVGPEDRFVLYPVRGIRRKNVGEALLYSRLAPAGTVVGLTLEPLNPAERRVYAAWKRLATELSLSFRFALGAPGGLCFAENLAAADQILTTSLAEGFGMVFLESWLAGRPLVGRDLPEITADFVSTGVRYDWLRPRLRVPVAWVGAEAFRGAVAAAYRKTLAAYNRPPAAADLEAAVDAKIEDGMLDFGDLDEAMQEEVIRAVCHDEQNRRHLRECNPWLQEAFSVGPRRASRVIRENAEVIRRHYSPAAIGRRLVDLYEQVAASPRGRPPRPLPHRDRILQRLLDQSRFRLIRT